jgi:hypothetical protein
MEERLAETIAVDIHKITRKIAYIKNKPKPILWIMDKTITTLPPLPDNLAELHIFHTPIESLPNLPSRLVELEIYDTKIEMLPKLPKSLKRLSIRKSPLKSLPNLNVGLDYLNIKSTEVTKIPYLPYGLRYLNINYTNIVFLPELPSSLKNLTCSRAPLLVQRGIRRGKYCSIHYYNYSWEFWRKRVQIMYHKTPEQVLHEENGIELLRAV